jgi:hypothetical protein
MLMPLACATDCSLAVVAYSDCIEEVIYVLRKVITWAIVLFVVYYLATNPTGAAHALQQAFNGLKSAGNSMSRFVNKL